jgi:hypothetical protein
MAIRSLQQLKAWFSKGKYPSATQFADWMDSFFHKSEDKVPIGSVDGLPDVLNGKYDVTDAEALAERLNSTQQSLDNAQDGINNAFGYIYELEAEDDRMREEFTGVHSDIDGLHETDDKLLKDIATLYDADTKHTESLDVAHGDIGKIGDLIKEGATLSDSRTALVALGKNYKDVYALALTLKTFLEANDTANQTINTWQEIETFLHDITDADSLTGLLEELRANITMAYLAAIAEAVKIADDRAKRAENTLTSNVATERKRAEEAEVALWAGLANVANNLKKTDNDILQDMVAVKQTILAMQSDNVGRIIPLAVEVHCPKEITLGNTMVQKVDAQLLPRFAIQNVIYLDDGMVVDVSPDGTITPHRPGRSRIHVIPTENTALHKTVEVNVVRPRMVKASSDVLLLSGGGNIILT